MLPLDGVVAKRWLLSGDIAQPGQAIFTITNTGKWWVEVNIEETRLYSIHIGQKAVLLSIDAFHGPISRKDIFLLETTLPHSFRLITTQ